MTRVAPFSVRIFLPTGEPEGLRIIEKSNWSGIGLAFRRSIFSSVKSRTELQKTGVYVLWAENEERFPSIYVGESDELIKRLENHHWKKDFWTNVVAFTSKDLSLNKAHVQYLEAKLLLMAREAKRCKILNEVSPTLPSLSEAEFADAESYFQDVLLCLPLIGLSVFEVTRAPATTVQRLSASGKGAKAIGVEAPEGFVVLKGSTAAKDEAPSIPPGVRAARQKLVELGVLSAAPDAYTFTTDYAFTSPSSAAGVVLGRSANGLLEWKNSKGEPLKKTLEAENESD